MEAIARAQTRYLELRLAACRARPDIHAHQIAAYENHLARMAEAADVATYMRMADMFAIAQAEVLDRYYNEVCVYAALGADRRVSAALLWYEAAAGALDHADLLARLGAAARASEALRQADDYAANLVPRLLVALVEWHTEATPSLREEHLDEIRAFWKLLRQSDRDLSWQRICEYPPYRFQSPFDDQRMHEIGAWLERAVADLPISEDSPPPATSSRELLDKARALKEAVLEEARERADRRAAGAASAADAPAAAMPSATLAASGYHASCEALERSDGLGPAQRTVYDRVFAIEEQSADALDFAVRMASEKLHGRVAAAPHIDSALQTKQHCQGLSQPHLERQCDELVEVMQRCETATEVEVEVARLDAVHGIEIAWNEVLLAYVTRAIAAALSYEAGRTDDKRETVEKSYRMVCNFFGRDWGGLIETPRIRGLVGELIFGRGQELAPADAPGPGALRGELGLGLAIRAREAAVWHMADAGSRESFTTPEQAEEYIAKARRPRFSTREALEAHLTALLDDALGEQRNRVRLGPPERAELRMWGQRVHLDRLLEVYRQPPRPEVRFP